MYIWIGINVNDQLTGIRSRAEEIEKLVGFENSCYTLPLHISLKISFNVADDIYPEVIETILKYYKSVKSFELEIQGIENEGTIVWIRMKENEALDRLHDELDRILLEKYSVGRHEYDLDYKFHTTLFMDSDSDKIAIAYEKIKDYLLPRTLKANKLLLGASESGALGTFRVTHNIDVE